ncbi:hypothetical protein EAF00_001331 [Botryotinia globosa]|nr:hypothetical protein EAF00_001331 [Botryotinia globosa]
MSTLQFEAKSSVDDFSALPQDNQHHLNTLEHAEAIDVMESDSLEVSTLLPETAKTQKLCHFCEPMFSTIESLESLMSDEGYKHHTITGVKEFERFERFELGNSHMRVRASLVEERIEDGLPLPKRKSIFNKEHLLPRSRESTISIQYPFDGCKLDGLTFNSHPKRRYFPLCFLADEGSRAGVYIERQPPVSKDNFGRIIPQMKKWLDDCRHHHSKHCRYSIPELPTRVLQIESETTNLVRLHVSRPNQKDDYIALSYCWGGPQSFITTTSNLDHNMCDFDVDNLPLTFRDTISIAKSLGIRYVWIDALCIIQDSDADKAREIEAMGDIFKNATVTISAASATSADGGLFGRRTTEDLFQISLRLPDKSLSKIYIAERKDPQASEEPVNQRAWCFQESILSPRVLSFRSTELLWHCQTLQYEPVAESNYFYHGRDAEIPGNIFGLDVEIESKDAFHRVQTWNLIVEGFTARHLTNPEDRLPAISGIANEFALAWNDEHVLGVMRSTIEYHLAWKAPRHGDLQVANPRNLGNGRAPSWSWVSIDYPVRFTKILLQPGFTATCLEIDNTPACGKIVLEAKLLSLKAHPMNSEDEKLLQEYYDFDEDLKAEACTLMLLAECEDTLEACTLMLLAECEDRDGNPGCNLCFLILKRLSNGYYQRVGLLDCWLIAMFHPPGWRYAFHDWMRPEILRNLLVSIKMSQVTIV